MLLNGYNSGFSRFKKTVKATSQEGKAGLFRSGDNLKTQECSDAYSLPSNTTQARVPERFCRFCNVKRA